VVVLQTAWVVWKVKLVPAVKRVKCDVDGTEEISIKGDAIDIKDEIPEAITLASVKTENTIRLQGLFEVVATHAFRPFITTRKEILKLHLSLSCFVLYCVVHTSFEIWIAILKRRDFLEVIASNGRIILKFILKK
jgi:hypothetical protein